ncbi:MAG: methyltransferase domain-containing protein [Alphaproteobacteria bacterium]|nr:methyltransferase domain-containing protein [Alphaproteobacteria bacterium]
MGGVIQIFDRATVRRRRERTSAGLVAHDFLLRAAAERLGERLGEVRRPFSRALLLGAAPADFLAALHAQGVAEIVVAEPAAGRLKDLAGMRLVVDEERLPFAPHCFDLVLSLMTLHWVNDLPGALVQINRMLRPDGLFLAVFPGGRTLSELRAALLEGEVRARGGSSPRVSPFVEVRDGGDLLHRAGFTLPVADADLIRITYADALALMRELRGMGESNALHDRPKGFTRRATLLAAATAYQARHADAEGRIAATVELIFLTGWRADPSQPKARPRGSGQVDLGQVLGSRSDPPPSGAIRARSSPARGEGRED